ncbi:unnamed protein product, partial [Discosporangium mesarthrocarpum]
LGTPCTRTFVTRTLVGEPGTTYKYLGLSHPWDRSAAHSGCAPEALQAIGHLNQILNEQSRNLLEEHSRARGGSTTGGCSFDVALINAMEPATVRPDLKLEPLFGRDRCSVSWHADSSLEHFSTIAVYHVTDPEPLQPDWRIALRVEHQAEGPNAKKLKTPTLSSFSSSSTSSSFTKSSPAPVGSSGTTTPVKAPMAAPPVAVPLPSRCSYYLLDDFNHHHQHAVLAGESRRWASTHRVLREGHNLEHITRRCQAVIKDAHKRTVKQWRAEQQALSELEFEWIRQFYIQGSAHYNLHSWWHQPLKDLLGLWSQLESRTHSVLATLRGAAEASLGNPSVRGESGQERTTLPPLPGAVLVGDLEQHHVVAVTAAAVVPPRREKKRRLKRLKQLEVVGALGESAFSLMADALRERAGKRGLWGEREDDKVFSRMPKDARPMKCPLFSPEAPSPLPSSLTDLAGLADAITCWQQTFTHSWQKPHAPTTALAPEPNSTKPQAATGGTASPPEGRKGKRGRVDENGKIPCARATPAPVGEVDWDLVLARGGGVALEVQAPWAARLVQGKKIVETRAYPLPTPLLGHRLEILESKPGRDGVSTLPDCIVGGARDGAGQGLRVVGHVTVQACRAYASRGEWEADAKRHLVPIDSPPMQTGAEGQVKGKRGYGWGGPGSVYQWEVGLAVEYEVARPVPPMT